MQRNNKGGGNEEGGSE
jgi:hypothetical protein